MNYRLLRFLSRHVTYPGVFDVTSKLWQVWRGLCFGRPTSPTGCSVSGYFNYSYVAILTLTIMIGPSDIRIKTVIIGVIYLLVLWNSCTSWQESFARAGEQLSEIVLVITTNWEQSSNNSKMNENESRCHIYIGQRIVTHVPVGFCTKFSDFHPELRIFMNFSWVIVMYHFVGCSNVYLKIIVKYEGDHHIRDPLTRDLDFPIFFLIDFKFWHVHFRLCHSVSF